MAFGSSKKPKPGPLHGGKSVLGSNSKNKGTQDRDDQHPDNGGEIWTGTRRFGAFRPKKGS